MEGDQQINHQLCRCCWDGCSWSLHEANYGEFLYQDIVVLGKTLTRQFEASRTDERGMMRKTKYPTLLITKDRSKSGLLLTVALRTMMIMKGLRTWLLFTIEIFRTSTLESYFTVKSKSIEDNKLSREEQAE